MSIHGVNRNYKLEVPAALKGNNITSPATKNIENTQTVSKTSSKTEDKVDISEISKLPNFSSEIFNMDKENSKPAYKTVLEAASKLKYEGKVCINATEKMAENFLNELKKYG